MLLSKVNLQSGVISSCFVRFIFSVQLSPVKITSKINFPGKFVTLVKNIINNNKQEVSSVLSPK